MADKIADDIMQVAIERTVKRLVDTPLADLPVDVFSAVIGRRANESVYEAIDQHVRERLAKAGEATINP